MKWQPIETAPKDYTDVLICDISDKNIYIGYYDKLAKAYLTNTEDGLVYTHPTHWMPLPEPPENNHFKEIDKGYNLIGNPYPELHDGE